MNNHYYIPALKGVDKDAHYRIIPDNKCGDVSNVWFRYEKVGRRPGYTALGTNTLHGIPTGYFFFERLNDMAKRDIALTTRDVYQLQSDDTWSFLTETYTTGTVTCAASTTVTGTAVTWSDTWPRNRYQIGFSTTDPDSVTTWYDIIDWSGTDTLTLGATGPTVTDVEYVIRRCYRGSMDEDPYIFDYTTAPTASDNLLVMTNFIDPPKVYDGDAIRDIEDDGGTMPYYAKHCIYWPDANRLIFAYIKDTASEMHYPQTILYSCAGDVEDYTNTGSGLTNLVSDPTRITGLAVLKQRLYVFKQNSITEGYATGDATSPINFQEDKIRGAGTVSGRTIAINNDNIFFMGYDDIYIFNGISIQKIGKGIKHYLFENLNTNYVNQCHAEVVAEFGLYMLFVPMGSATYPNTCFVYDYNEGFWTIWNMGHYITGSDLRKISLAVPWDSIPTGDDWATYPGTWKRGKMSGEAPNLAMADSTGHIFVFDGTATSDNGTAISCYLITSDFDAGDQKHAKRFLEFIFNAEADDTAPYDSISFYCSIDYGNSWYGPVTVSLQGTDDMTDHVVNIIQYGKQIRYKIMNVAGGNMVVEGMILGMAPAGRGRALTIRR